MAPRLVKKEPGTANRGGADKGGEEGESRRASSRQEVTERRVLRSRYLAVKNLISDERDDISRADSDKFSSIITEVESLHKLVQKPREQVADAEALLDIANTLVISVKSQSNDGITPADFVTALLKNFGQQNIHGSNSNAQNTISWADVGLAVSHVFRKAPGCFTMVGPMSTEIKQRKAVPHRKRTRPTESTRPEELDDDTEPEKKTDTDKNMTTMFDVLRKKRCVRLENLVLNRVSFAQTVENIFALSFLVKDGRAEITVNDSGHHLVSPRNAPAAASKGGVPHNHFVFRYDFKDWKLMTEVVGPGEELMPHRSALSTFGSGSTSQAEPVHTDTQPTPVPTTPIRKLTRNRGLVIQEQSIEDTIVENSVEKEGPPRRKGKRLYE